MERKDRGIHKEDKTGGSWSEKNKISHFIPVWTAASCSCGSGSEDRGEVDKDTKIDGGESGKGETYETDSMADYEKYLEQKTAQTLGVVDGGAGKVTVMITLKSTGQKVVEKDQQSTHQTTKEADSQGETRESEEKSLDKTTVYSQGGTDGTQIPYVSKENAPEVEGILVIADGGGNAVVAKNLTEAVQALFGVEAHKIKIMKRAST